MKTVIYIRGSSAPEGRDSALERQRGECLRYAARKGWRVEKEVVDDEHRAATGRHSGHNELDRFVSDVQDGSFPDGVILPTTTLDRLWLDDAKSVFRWMQRVKELGVAVGTVEGDCRYDRDSLDISALMEVVLEAQFSRKSA